MVGILGTECTVWLDVRWEGLGSFIDWGALLKWSEGETFRTPLPQNTAQGGHGWSSGTPLFMTGPGFLRKGCPVGGAMMCSRFQKFTLVNPIPATRRKYIRPCQRCFVEWWLFDNGGWQRLLEEKEQRGPGGGKGRGK